ncbi:outer spore coat protein CotE [Paenibacillus apiarius]|uniref:Outer spore coat protein CotE n=1 Tax=Paenibacillus apiarius TaxID=46240 RepID=A0ABT4DX03_9BACL|nr:outer spore coat protein CotE [Paenibacillus apiarius]MCY9515878.1 outer spore coat protein CotE [Paenibacillus apiarius]MCY9520788.1 outer spore coat protein CotE [Paenibacillus apiarius]MCY9553492.1 outer spore coat protein CotE [Paenibacillus apiarius]MCY9557984.1 outer spore coat protein CotE [Paenibacillus apiarius]MCY9685839.1 outer spore coat protein CotE [Paenibacillus apiarius]
MAITDKHHSRQIITKAICGKGRKFSVVTHTVTPPHHPTSILGAWIINHQYESVRAGDGIEVIGTYDINIWYSYNNNSQTDVAKETVSYVDLVPLSYVDPKHRAATEEVSAEAIQEPNCVEASVSSSGTGVMIRVEREFSVEMVAETKVCVRVCPNGCLDFEDKDFDFGSQDDGFDDLDPDLSDEEL